MRLPGGTEPLRYRPGLTPPFAAGLDPKSRHLLSELLSSLHSQRAPRVLLILRPQDALPEFVTHLALTDIASNGDRLLLGPKHDMLATPEAQTMLEAGAAERTSLERKRTARREEALKREQGADAAGRTRRPLIELKGVNVSYGRPSEGQAERRVLKEVDWTVKEGERWVLAGHNGRSGSLESFSATQKD